VQGETGMQVIGMLGGMSWESSAEYYRLANELVKARLGRLHSAKILLYSVDFDEIERLQHAGQWSEAARLMIDGARRLEQGGADVLLICTNTMHKVADEVAEVIGIPLLHIVDATADAIRAAGIGCVGLLGTRFTMEQDFYRDRLAERHGLDVLIPDDGERQTVHTVIYDELCLGKVLEGSRRKVVGIIDGLVSRGAEGVVLGCTELPLLIRPSDVSVRLFDTTAIHVAEAVELALSAEG